jgi:hypothetical protein
MDLLIIASIEFHRVVLSLTGLVRRDNIKTSCVRIAVLWIWSFPIGPNFLYLLEIASTGDVVIVRIRDIKEGINRQVQQMTLESQPVVLRIVLMPYS